jgi:hypothetical protein
MRRLDELFTTTIELLEIRAGIPRRVIFRAAADFSTSAEAEHPASVRVRAAECIMNHSSKAIEI